MTLFLLVYDHYYKCLAQLPLPCQTISLPLSQCCKAINSVTVTEIPVQLEPMCTSILLYICAAHTTIFRALQTSPHDGYAGTALLFHPIDFRTQFEAIKEPFREACCEIDGFTDYCDLFFERRLINTGENYMPPSVGKLLVTSHNSTTNATCFTLLNCRARIRRPPLQNIRWTILYTEWIWRVHFDGISIC